MTEQREQKLLTLIAKKDKLIMHMKHTVIKAQRETKTAESQVRDLTATISELHAGRARCESVSNSWREQAFKSDAEVRDLTGERDAGERRLADILCAVKEAGVSPVFVGGKLTFVNGLRSTVERLEGELKGTKK